MLPTVDECLALDRRTLGGMDEQLSNEQQRQRFEETLPLSQVCAVRRGGVLVAYAMLQPQTDARWFVTCFNTPRTTARRRFCMSCMRRSRRW